VKMTVREAGVDEGVCLVSSTHTTAAVTVNEDYDRDVPRDLAAACRAFVESLDVRFEHAEGNSDSHLLTSLFGQSQRLGARRGARPRALAGRLPGGVRRPEEQDRADRGVSGLRAKNGGAKRSVVWLARCLVILCLPVRYAVGCFVGRYPYMTERLGGRRERIREGGASSRWGRRRVGGAPASA
jgi:hypothetical protein